MLTDDEIRVTPRCIFIRSLFGNFLVITMIPILIVYLFAQSKIIEGVANTGIKR